MADAKSPPDDPQRRDFLLNSATGVVVGAGLVTACWPFINSMNPSSDVLSKATTEASLKGISLGESKKVLRQLGGIMPFYDRSIDIVLATHSDKDHIGGLPDVLERYNVGAAVVSGVESKTSIYSEFEKIIDNKKIKKIFARAGQIIWLSDDTYIEILFPDRSTIGWESNTASVVARLVYGNTEFLFTGDSPKKIEKYLTAQYGEKLQSDVLKLGHHGSRTSTSEIFLSAVSPQYAIISAGENNRYGHPHKEVTDMLKDFEISSLATYERGTIIITSDGENVYVK